jgi:hypothetical protein
VTQVLVAANSQRSQERSQAIALQVSEAIHSSGSMARTVQAAATAGSSQLFLRGDIDCDTDFDEDDLTYLDNYLNHGGDPPPCMRAADIDGDGTVSQIDIEVLEIFWSGEGYPIPPPFPFCGTDQTPLPCDYDFCPGPDSVGFLRGDVDGDFDVDDDDLAYLDAFLYQSGDAPPCMRAADLDLDERISIMDLVILTNFLDDNGIVDSLPPPFPECGAEPHPPSALLPCDADCCNSADRVMFIRGDLDADGDIDSTDLDLLWAFAFDANFHVACLKAADLDLDGRIDIVDWAILTGYLDGVIDSLLQPWPECGVELAPTTIPCEAVYCRDEPNSSKCACDCASDPVCDGVCDVMDAVKVANVAFRNVSASTDPNVSCPFVASTDVDCSGATDVIDVVKTVGVAFRNGDAAQEFCDPCQP